MSEPNATHGPERRQGVAPAGWYPDPARRFLQRYWDGVRWSTHVSHSGGTMGTDQPVPPLPAVPPDPSQVGNAFAARARGQRNRAAAIVVIAGTAALAVGSVLPWATISSPIFGNNSVSGIRGDGQITLLLAIVVGVLGTIVLVSERGHKALLIVTLVISALAVVTCAIALNDASRVARRETGIPVNATVAYGLYVALAGGIGAAVGSIIGLRRRNGTPTAPTSNSRRTT
jgi:Protein of unknown function (DUF2510)